MLPSVLAICAGASLGALLRWVVSARFNPLMPSLVPPSVKILVQLGDVEPVVLERSVQAVDRPKVTVIVDDEVLKREIAMTAGLCLHTRSGT